MKTLFSLIIMTNLMTSSALAETSTFKVFFDGKQLFDAPDETFKGAGKVGVWTKADSVTLFDDFSYGAK
ncbi:MAG: hypothetical protein ACR2H1_12470 [Limisphaerales bacterium]